MVILDVGQHRIEISNDPTHSDRSADNVHIYYRTYRFGDDAYQATSRHAVRVTYDDDLVAACLLSADGGATGVHGHSAIIHHSSCIVAVGPFVASLALPSLELNWATQTDDATCFGVYDSPNHGCLFSHGELLIARLSYDGTIMWNAGGADIFTNDFRLDGNVVRVVDFNDREYLLDVDTGREIAA